MLCCIIILCVLLLMWATAGWLIAAACVGVACVIGGSDSAPVVGSYITGHSVQGEAGAAGATGELTPCAAVALDYPYRRYFTTETELEEAFARIGAARMHIVPGVWTLPLLSALGANELSYNGRQHIIADSAADDNFETTGFITDYFNGPCRVKCKRYNEPMTPLEYWTRRKEKIIADCRVRFGRLTWGGLEETIYQHVKGCTTFRPHAAAATYRYYGATSVLDISAGWGDRLVAALATGVRYVGIDPNTCLQKGYAEMIEKFGGGARQRVICAPMPAADAQIGAETFDMVFTSPPYFDVEVYSDESTQSISTFPEVGKWFDGFLAPTLHAAWARLQPGGYMVLHINNTPGKPDYVLRMRDYVSAWPDADPVGVLGKTHGGGEGKGGRGPAGRPVWVWRKIDSNPPLTIQELTVNDGRAIRVVRDDVLPGGTKSRAAAALAGGAAADILVYAGPWIGFAQVAIAVAAKLHGKRAVVFLARDDYETTRTARRFGAEIIVVRGTDGRDATLEQCQVAATEWVAERPRACLLPFGMDSAAIRAALVTQIRGAAMRPARRPAPCDLEGYGEVGATSLVDSELSSEVALDIDKEWTFWLVAGSAMLLGVLYVVFPRAKFNVVRVGKKIWPDQIEPARTRLFEAPEKFYEDAGVLPPYPHAAKYDAKLWRFVLEHGASDDIIWNVAGHPR